MLTASGGVAVAAAVKTVWIVLNLCEALPECLVMAMSASRGAIEYSLVVLLFSGRFACVVRRVCGGPFDCCPQPTLSTRCATSWTWCKPNRAKVSGGWLFGGARTSLMQLWALVVYSFMMVSMMFCIGACVAG